MILTSMDEKKDMANKSNNGKFWNMLFNTIYILSYIAVCAILISEFLFPIARIYDDSMESALKKDDVVLLYKTKSIEKGDIVAFYVGNKLLIKRCIAIENEIVDIDTNGNVFVDNKPVEEKYVANKEYGNVEIDLPYCVAHDSIFVLSDVRSNSNDSRNVFIASINKEQILGKVLFKIAPIRKLDK